MEEEGRGGKRRETKVRGGKMGKRSEEEGRRREYMVDVTAQMKMSLHD